MTSIPDRTRGMALVEVAIALMLLAAGSAALLRLQLQALETSREHQALTQATWLARDCLSRLLHAATRSRNARADCPALPGWHLARECRANLCMVRLRQSTPPFLELRMQAPRPTPSS
ncbi:MAG TPA: hypothetical protein ENK53_09385 [Thiotrichales bacterium]|nr:hypothetical protein [Thiotrichales bacterium]